MSTVKLVKDGKVIERSKVDYEHNEGNWKIRGWSLYEGKPKAQPKPKKDEPIISMDSFNNKEAKHKEEKKKTKKKAK